MGEMTLFTHLFAVVGTVAAITDYRSGKIYNWLTYPAMLLALIYSSFHGVDAFTSSLLGMVLSFILFFPLFFWGIMGAGDAKLMMVFAGFLGHHHLSNLILYSFLVGGIGSFVILIARGRFVPFMKEFVKFFKTLITPGLALQWPKLDKLSKAPFGIAITTAFLPEVYFL